MSATPEEPRWIREWRHSAPKHVVEYIDKLRAALVAAEERVKELKAHAIKYIDPIMGSDSMVKDAEDWIENRMARHGEGHHALVGIYPCDMGMLTNALKSLRIRLYKSEQRAEAAERQRDEARAEIERLKAAAPATVPVEPVAWIHCSPELLASGIDCGTTPRRPCECAIKGSHDHLIRIAHPADTFRRAIERAAWMPIETAPKDGRTMLLGHFNDCGKWRTLRGQWFSKEQIAEEWENDENEEGWYETSVENDDIPNCWPTDPSHWQPLPAPPAAP